MQINIGILGSGRFSQVAAGLLSRGPSVSIRVWARDPEKAKSGTWPSAAEITDDIEVVAGPADLVLLGVTAGGLEAALDSYGPFARGDQIVLHGCRGAGPGFRLPHEMVRATTCVRKIGALGGPLSSQDLDTARLMPLILASRFDETFAIVRRLTEKGPIALHTSRDVLGVEMAGVVSNINALAQGMADACGFSETSKGLLLAHGLADAQRLGVHRGAQPQTFTGIAALGDLIPRQVSSTDRHRAFGHAIASDQTAAEAELEGVTTAAEASRFASEHGLSVPLIEAVQRVLERAEEPRSALERVLSVDLGELGPQ